MAVQTPQGLACEERSLHFGYRGTMLLFNTCAQCPTIVVLQMHHESHKMQISRKSPRVGATRLPVFDALLIVRCGKTYQRNHEVWHGALLIEHDRCQARRRRKEWSLNMLVSRDC